MKKTLAVLLSLCLLLPCLFTGWTLPASAETTVNPDEITGTVSEDYKPAAPAVGISSLDQITDLNGNYYLTADITANTTTVKGNFAGILDGCGHTVTSSVTLFEFVFGGTVKNLVIEGDISCTVQSGSVAKWAAGATFFNIWNKGTADTCIVMYDVDMTEIVVDIFKHFSNGFLVGEVAAICKCLYPIFFA